ncbi:MAG: class I SAM-dependent methyltransferase [Sinomicrobium sp.]|nr:class I SAM-dependent methyltransferase [Sinomicrobium sp.]
MNIRSYVWLITIFLVAGCKEKEHSHTDHNKSNIYMNRNAFDDLVKGFEAPDRALWQKPEEVIAMLGDIQGKTVMDIGAGTGYFSFRMAARGATVIAADVDERFLEYIETKKSETGVQSVLTRKVPYDDPKLEENEADAVIIVDTYHHIENRVAYFRNVLKGLKPDGKLMVVDFKKEETPHGPPQDHRLQPDEVIAELRKAGFTDFKSNTTALAYQYIIIAVKKEL